MRKLIIFLFYSLQYCLSLMNISETSGAKGSAIFTHVVRHFRILQSSAVNYIFLHRWGCGYLLTAISPSKIFYGSLDCCCTYIFNFELSCDLWRVGINRWVKPGAAEFLHCKLNCLLFSSRVNIWSSLPACV